MRRAALVPMLAVSALLSFVPGVAAIGPGGWDHLGHGATATTPSLDGTVYALNADEPGLLLVGGNFTTAGGNTNANQIATWNGSAWGALGTGIGNGSVLAIAYHAGKVYAGGTFTNAGGDANADFLAVWDGVAWGPFCNATGPAFGGNVMALQVIGNTLYVGGAFQNGAGLVAADYLLACDMTTGASSATVDKSDDIGGAVYALTADSNGTLYAGGGFINVDGILAADHVAAYDGTWHAMGAGGGTGGGAVDSFVRGLAASGTDVYIGTDSVDVAGIANADHVARWNGSAWSAVGSNSAGTNGWFTTTTFINALTTSGPLLFAAGSFQNANGVATADDIAYFDGTTWRPIGSNGAGNGPYIGNSTALAPFRSKVYASGSFTSAGGDTMARSIAGYALKLPDARIGTASTGPWSGNAIYSATGAGESRTQYVSRSHSVTYYANFQNDGLMAAAFTITGTGSARGYSVTYYRGATNVTAAVKAGTYSTGFIAARSSCTLKVVVTRGTSSASSVAYLVRATSAAGTPADAVKVIARAK
ncbi:MAG: hypothetical protein WCK58_02350 [Chloroflexota bacterium]